MNATSHVIWVKRGSRDVIAFDDRPLSARERADLRRMAVNRRAKERRDARRRAGVCIDQPDRGEKHGPVTTAGRCEDCWLKKKLGRIAYDEQRERRAA